MHASSPLFFGGCWGESKDRRGVSGNEGDRGEPKERELGGCFCTRENWEDDPEGPGPSEELGRRLALRFGVGGPGKAPGSLMGPTGLRGLMGCCDITALSLQTDIDECL